MPLQQAQTPKKNPRGSRRPSRKSASSTPSQSHSTQKDPESPTDAGRNREPDQPMRILRRGDHDTPADLGVVGNSELPNPTTPPRPRSMYDGFSNGQYQGNQSAPDMQQRRKKGRKSQGGITRASGIRRPDLNDPPLSLPPQQLLTPNRPNGTPGTPVKAYAGPTFHASPAASSLPIPKFFSKSVPNVEKTSGLKSRMEQEPVDTTSESDVSPFLENSKLSKDRRAREDSPLEIFFQADRNAKAKVQDGSLASSNGLRSELQDDVRHHSRQPSDSSLREMFPLEMDGTVPEIPDDTDKKESTNPAPKTMTFADFRNEQRKTQTLELKKLLYSPKPQHPASSSPRSDIPSRGLGSPSPKLAPRGGSPRQVPGGASRDQKRHAALLALAQKQITASGTNNGSTTQRPPSSNLWKEMSVPSSPGVQPLELPATPTQSRVQKISTPTNNHIQQQQNGYASPYPPYSSAFTPPTKPTGGFQNTPSRDFKDAKSIEEDLRRILNLDVLGGDGITGVQS